MGPAVRKSIRAKHFCIAILVFGLPCWHAVGQVRNSHQLAFPKACYFFANQNEDESQRQERSREPAEERAYHSSMAKVNRLWCTRIHSNPAERTAAVDNMVRCWKAVWDRDDPFNAAFHETAASDLLELMGLTRELPTQMAGDREFTKAWVEACSETCFTIWSVPKNSTQEHSLAMQLWLRNDLLDNLKKEPASEPIVQMLQDARYRLVD